MHTCSVLGSLVPSSVVNDAYSSHSPWTECSESRLKVDGRKPNHITINPGTQLAQCPRTSISLPLIPFAQLSDQILLWKEPPCYSTYDLSGKS
jgi:hypothetical protein